jgi:hypothetical protein
VRATDARFQHAAAPDRNAALATDGFDTFSFAMTTDAAQFYIDNPTGIELDCVAGIFGAMD